MSGVWVRKTVGMAGSGLCAKARDDRAGRDPRKARAAASVRMAMALAPVGRALEGAAPQPQALVARGALVGEIAAVAVHEADRIAFAHHDAADVGDAAGRAGRQRAAVTVAAVRCAGDRTLRHQRGEPLARRQAAGASLAARVAAALRLLRRVDADQADALGAGAQGVAVD